MFDPTTVDVVTKRRDELARQDTQLAAEEAGIRSKRESIAQELERLQIAVEVFESFRKLAASVEPDTVTSDAIIEIKPDNGSRPDLTGLKIADAAAVVLAHHGGEARAAAILRELQAAQRIAPGHGSYSTLHKTMAGDARFEKVDRGLWRLKENGL